MTDKEAISHTLDPKGFRVLGFRVLSPLSSSWLINIIWLYMALHRTPNIDCYWVGAVPKISPAFRKRSYQQVGLVHASVL